jgi:hypothetical protein
MKVASLAFNTLANMQQHQPMHTTSSTNNWHKLSKNPLGFTTPATRREKGEGLVAAAACTPYAGVRKGAHAGYI